MKKLFLFLSFCISTSALAITHTLINATGVPVMLQLDLRMYPDEFILLQPGNIKNIYVGMAPLRSITAEMRSLTTPEMAATNISISESVRSARPWGRIIVVYVTNGNLGIKIF